VTHHRSETLAQRKLTGTSIGDLEGETRNLRCPLSRSKADLEVPITWGMRLLFGIVWDMASVLATLSARIAEP
jgi:hypothetical protein